VSIPSELNQGLRIYRNLDIDVRS